MSKNGKENKVLYPKEAPNPKAVPPPMLTPDLDQSGINGSDKHEKVNEPPKLNGYAPKSQKKKRTSSNNKGKFSSTADAIGTNFNAVEVRDVIIHQRDNNARKWSLTIWITLAVMASVVCSYYWITEWSVSADSEQYISWLNKGDSLLAEGLVSEAKAAYEKAELYSPGDEAANKKLELLDKGTEYMKLGDHERSRATFEMVMTLAPNLDLEIGTSDEGSVDHDNQEKSATGATKPMVVRIKRLGSGTIEIRVSGGKPFKDPNRPYHILGLDEKQKIEWRKEGEVYFARLEGMKNASVLNIKVKDSKGKTKTERIPGLTTKERFDYALAQADNWFDKAQFARAKKEYQNALDYQPGNAHAKTRIKECQAKIDQLDIQKQLNLVLIQGGSFQMGRNDGEPDERPRHRVELRSFYITKTPVTVADFRAYTMASGEPMPNAPSWGWQDDHPMVNVSHEEAEKFALWAGGRLPTEAEWEYAARGGQRSNGFLFSGSNQVNEVAWYQSNNPQRTTQPVASKSVANELGLADMTGNVWEWVSDWYSGTYFASTNGDNPIGPLRGEDKILKGGSWQSPREHLSVYYRNFRTPSYRGNDIGFRIVVNAPENNTGTPNS